MASYMLCQKNYVNYDQKYFNDIFITALSAFENVAFKIDNKIRRKYSNNQPYDLFKNHENLEMAMEKAFLQFNMLKSTIDLLNKEGKVVNFPFQKNELKEIEKDIENWEKIIKQNSDAKYLYEKSLEKIKDLITEGTKIGKASEYCYKNAFESSKGLCGAHVRDALNYAGFDFPTKGFNAYKFYKENDIKHLEKRGFKEIPLKEGFKNKLDGDIVVEESKGKHKDGHVQIYNAKHDKWVSDFIQNGEAMVHRDDIGQRHYYRYCPKFPCIKYEYQKKNISNYDSDDNDDSGDHDHNYNTNTNIKYNNSSYSFPVNDNVSVQPKFGISRDGKPSFQVNVSVSIPCIIF